MSPNAKNQQIEFEVFPKDNKSDYSYLENIKTENPSESATVNIIVSHQSIIIIFICVLMSVIASFTLGVEKGKLVAKNTVAEEKKTLALPVSISGGPAALEKLKMPAINKVSDLAAQKETAPVISKDAAEIPLLAQPASTPQKEETMLKNGYTIQVATLKTEQAAKGLSDTLVKKGWHSFTKSSGKYVVVLAGNFTKREDALLKLKELKKTYADCFIKKI
jgi:cell division septation protein DedD